MMTLSFSSTNSSKKKRGGEPLVAQRRRWSLRSRAQIAAEEWQPCGQPWRVDITLHSTHDSGIAMTAYALDSTISPLAAEPLGRGRLGSRTPLLSGCCARLVSFAIAGPQPTACAGRCLSAPTIAEGSLVHNNKTVSETTPLLAAAVGC